MRGGAAGSAALLGAIAGTLALVAANQRPLTALAVIGLGLAAALLAWRATAPRSFACLHEPSAAPWLARAAAVVLALVALDAGYRRAFHSDLRALAVSIADDSFYYLLPALRFRSAGVFTFDGIHPTYGFQPLWELLLVALAAAVPDRHEFLRVALFVPHLLRLATAAVLFQIGHETKLAGGGPNAPAALLAASLYLLNAPLLFASVECKENALYGLLLAWLMLHLLRLERGATPSPRRCGAALGLGLAGVLLARLSPASLAVAAVAAAYAWRAAPRARAALTLAAAAPLVAWSAYALSAFDTLFPVSGTVKLQGFFDAPPWARGWSELARLAGAVVEYVGQALAFAVGCSSHFVPLAGRAMTLVVRWISVALALVVAASLVRRLTWARPAPPRVAVQMLGAALVGTSVVPVFLDHLRPLWYFKWYLAELPVLAAILCASRVRLRLRGAGLTVVMTALAVVVARDALVLRRSFRPLREFRADDTWQNVMLRAGERAQRHVANRPVRLAAFNSGLLGYFARAPVVNLDGLANDDVVRARRAGESLYGYVARNQIDYIVDVMPEDGWFGGPFAHYEVVERLPFSRGDPPGYFIARVTEADFPPLVARECPTPAARIRLVKWTDEPIAGARQRILTLSSDARAPTRLVLGLERRFDAFECGLVARGTPAGGRSTAWVSVRVDGKTVWRARLRGGDRHVRRVRLDVRAAARLGVAVSRGRAGGPVEVALVDAHFTERR